MLLLKQDSKQVDFNLVLTHSLQFTYYCMRAIITRVFFTPFATVVYFVEPLVLLIIYVLNREIHQFLGLKSAVYNQGGFQVKSGL